MTVFLDELSERDVHMELVWVRIFPTDLQLVDCLASDFEVLIWVQALLLRSHAIISTVIGGGGLTQLLLTKLLLLGLLLCYFLLSFQASL